MHTLRAVAVIAVASTAALGIAAPIASAASGPYALTGAISAVRPTSAVATATVNPEGVSTKWYFQYGTTTAYGSDTPANSAGAGTANVVVSAAFGGLQTATTYHYRVVATNSAGTTVGGDGIFSTTAVPNVATESPSNLGTTSATFNGTVDAEGQVTKWWFVYGTSTAYGSKTPTSTLAAGPGNVNVASTVATLAAHTTYHYRLYASNGSGTSHGSDLSFTTGLAVTIDASTYSVIYGSPVTIFGAVSSKVAGVTVTISDRQFDRGTVTPLAQVTTGANGTWTYVTRPSSRTTYQASASVGTSSPLVIGVRPRVTLVVLSGARFSTTVSGDVSFGLHVLQLQRLSNGIWVTVKREAMDRTGRAIFAASLLPHGTNTVRTAIGPDVIGPDQAAPGYLAGYSNPRSYRNG
jgi:hypothetical protein